MHIFKYTNVGSKSWEACAIEASERGAMMTSSHYSVRGGWFGHRLGNIAMVGDSGGSWNSYRTATITSSKPCVLGLAYNSKTQRNARLSGSVVYDGLEWEYEDYGQRHWDECVKLADAAGANIITPYTIGKTGADYWVFSTLPCNTYEYIRSGGNSMAYDNLGSKARSSQKKCMVGYVNCVGSCVTTTTTTTVPCGPENIGGKGEDYNGCQTKTKSGKDCQMWSSQTPHKHTYSPSKYPNANLNLNYCRNPGGSQATIWCFTVNASQKWETCTPVPTTTTTTTTPSPPNWVLGEEGENCLTTCGVDNCWETYWWPAQEQDFKAILDEMNFKRCTSIDAGDWQVNPALYIEYGDMCFWKTNNYKCSGHQYGIRRFCPCINPLGTTTQPPTTTTEGKKRATEAPTTTTPPWEGDKPPTERRRRGGKGKGKGGKGKSRRRRRRTEPEEETE
jgi:hypothetical protein